VLQADTYSTSRRPVVELRSAGGRVVIEPFAIAAVEIDGRRLEIEVAPRGQLLATASSSAAAAALRRVLEDGEGRSLAVDRLVVVDRGPNLFHVQGEPGEHGPLGSEAVLRALGLAIAAALDPDGSLIYSVTSPAGRSADMASVEECFAYIEVLLLKAGA
jgi:hypothetical protein